MIAWGSARVLRFKRPNLPYFTLYRSYKTFSVVWCDYSCLSNSTVHEDFDLDEHNVNAYCTCIKIVFKHKYFLFLTKHECFITHDIIIIWYNILFITKVNMIMMITIIFRIKTFKTHYTELNTTFIWIPSHSDILL